MRHSLGNPAPSSKLDAQTRPAAALPALRTQVHRNPAPRQRSHNSARCRRVLGRSVFVCSASVDTRQAPGGTSLFFSDSAPSWDDLAALVEEKRSSVGLPVEDLENGVASAHATKRTFGKSEPPRVVLYRDVAAWCPFCQKVWIVLEEKKIPYEVVTVPLGTYGTKPEWFLEMNPEGQVPVIKLDGKVIVESEKIIEAIEEEFPEIPLTPKAGTPEREMADKIKEEGNEAGGLFGPYISLLRENTEENRAKFEARIDQFEGWLAKSGGPYFLGENFSLVDIDFVPSLERTAGTMLYFIGLNVRSADRWPFLAKWYTVMGSRPSCLATRLDFYSSAFAFPPMISAEVSEAGEPYARIIDGRDGTSWRLPLEPLSDESLEPYSPGDEPEFDTVRAADRLVRNHEAVVKFALRGVGEPGDPPFRSPMADPNAIPGMQHEKEVDAAMRHVAHALLVGADNAKDGVRVSGQEGDLSGEPVGPSLGYLRDRVGVPRDFTFPVARQFRAHLNWMIDLVSA